MPESPWEFVKDLKRRRVFRVAALYIVGAWVALQVADTAFPGIGIPEAAIRYVWMGAICGLPIALILGWRFDIAAGGIVRTPKAGGHENLPLGRTDHTILATLSLLVMMITAGLLWQIWLTRELPLTAVADTGLNPRSIAVLPFENISGEQLNQPFTTGIHDDILTHISKISDLKVISRTSVVRLATTMSIPNIGELLGVATVLEGGVQRVGDQIRINVQLIDAVTDQHLWAETFNRELTAQSIFDIQTEIAQAISNELQVTLSLQDRTNLERRPTKNLQAYEVYMLGKQRMSLRTSTGLIEATEYYQRALELDPDYALAYVGLADANTILGSYGYQPQAVAIENARQAINSALRLDNQLGAAYASQGLVFSNNAEYANAEASFKHAIELDPNYASAFHWYGNMLVSNTGQPGRAVPLLESARALDPLSPIINVTLGEAFEAIGQFDNAMTLYKKAVEIEPDFAAAYFLIGVLYRSAYGRLNESVRWHREEFSRDPSRGTSILGMAYLDLGDDKTAEYWFERAFAMFPRAYLPNAARVILHWYRGEETQSVEAARQLLELAPGNNLSLVTLVKFSRYQEALDKISDYYPALSCAAEPVVSRSNFFQAINLSLAQEKTGNPECAGRLLEKALEQTANMPRLGSQGYGFADVEIYARQGKTQLALAALRQAIDSGTRINWWSQAQQSPHNESLFEEPEFKAMMDEIKADMASQLEWVRQLDIDGELAPMPVLGNSAID